MGNKNIYAISTITKIDLSDRVAETASVTKRQASLLVDLVFATIKRTLASGQTVKISGFGHFTLLDKRSRRGRNLQTGEAVTISARRVISFKVSDSLRKKVNEGREETTSF